MTEGPTTVRIKLAFQTTTIILPANLAVQIIEAIAAREGYLLEQQWDAKGTVNLIRERVDLELWTAADHAKSVMDTANFGGK